MKRCPKCNAEYFDNLLDFCLEDGAKLSTINDRSDIQNKSAATTEMPRVAQTNTTAVLPEFQFQTESLQKDSENKNPQTQIPIQDNFENKSKKIKDTARDQGYRALEIIPMIISLAHNYWQWIYLYRQNYYDFVGYIFSANFLIWLALLICGVIFGIISLKYGKSKSFAITALIILAINFLLFLVPKQNY
jgi:hypothetical protein